MLADVKSNVDTGGRERFSISRLSMLKNDRISSFLAEDTESHSSDVPATTVCHSASASLGEVEDSL